MSGGSGGPVVTNSCAFFYFAREAAGVLGAWPHALKSGAKVFMHSSGASRRGIADSYIPVIARSEATKQSTLSFLLLYGLLRGACHRARIRATRWIAMTSLGCLKVETGARQWMRGAAGMVSGAFTSRCRQFDLSIRAPRGLTFTRL